MDRDRYTTPPEIVDRVHRLWPAGPDLDPFWDPDGLIHGAMCYSIREDDQGDRGDFEVIYADGFTTPWHGCRVWCQPPYSLGNTAKALALCAGHRAWGGEVVALVNLGTATTYWRESVYPSASCIVFPKRIAFYHSGVRRRGNEYSQAVIYYGDDVPAFLCAFGDMSPAWHLDTRARRTWKDK